MLLLFEGTKDSGFVSDLTNNTPTANGNGEAIMMDNMTDDLDAQIPFNSKHFSLVGQNKVGILFI